MPLTEGEVPGTGFSFDLTDPRGLVMTLFSVMLGFVGLVYVWRMATNRGVPLLDSLLGSLSPALQSGGSSGTVFD